MQQLIASYLFQHNTCPLPGLGTLNITVGNASADFLNKTITPPPYTINFLPVETAAEMLVDYIAFKNQKTVLEAIDMLGKYCNQLKGEINDGNVAVINSVGSFIADSHHKINFKAAPFSVAFLPAVTAERVIHPEATHSIVVGDKERTNMQMTEYYMEEEAGKKSYGWLWAVLLAVTALIIILIYYSNFFHAAFFGNANAAI
jgi:hypothetical protein